MANTNEQNNINYYEIMYNLKLFWQEASELKSIAEWEIFNAKFLQYIFSVTELKETYTAGVNTFLNKDLKEARKEFYNNFLSKFLCADIDYSLRNSYPRILYFEVPNNYTQQDVDLNRVYYNIVDLYLKNCDKDIDFEFIKKYTDIIENIDYFILSYLNNEPLFFSDDIVFSKLYLKAVFNGVYNHLKGAIICKISNEYYKGKNEEFKSFKLKYLKDSDTFILDDKVFKLEPQLKNTLKIITGSCEPEDGFDEEDIRPDYVSKINSLARKSINLNLISRKNQNKNYTILPHIKY